MPGRGRRRSLLVLTVGLICGLAAFRLVCYQGWLGPIRIASGSMAPTLLGAHVAVVCEDCRFSFVCDATSRPETGEVVCPNCGFRGNRLTAGQLRRGQRVVIDRLPYRWRQPRRWELVAFQDPLVPTQKSVKRVIGLPAETIVIHRGDLFINGRIARKPLPVQRDLAVLVHDDAFRPLRTRDLPPRWRPETEPSGWRQVDSGYEFTGAAADVDWLSYRNWRCFATPLARSAESPVLDHYGYNQNTSRQLHTVSDLTLDCRVRWSRPGTLHLRVEPGGDVFELAVDWLRGRATIQRNGTEIGRHPVAAGRMAKLEFGVCDRQVFLTVDQRIAFRHPYEPTPYTGQPTSRPLAIGARRGAVHVDHPRIYRDVYYLDRDQLGRDQTLRGDVGRGEVIVLGDNVPISSDSRRWPTPGLARKSLFGRVLTPF